MPPVDQLKWLQNWRFIENASHRWWNFSGGVYVLRAIKRTHGMRLITPKWKTQGVRAKALLQHPDFSLKNPNRVRSLINALCSGNPAAFHRTDAAGYVFWADLVLELDGLNPQLAGRIARAMDRWTVLAGPLRSAAREAIARVAARPDLSPDLREIVTHALEGH